MENLKAPVKGIVGPWVHKYPHIALPEPRIGFLQEALRWWDRWLKDIDTGVENDADLRLFMIENSSAAPSQSGRWINQNFRNAPEKVLHLAADGLHETASAFSTRVDCTADTGAFSEEFFIVSPDGAFTREQTPDDQRSI